MRILMARWPGLALVDSLHKTWLLLASIGHGAKGPPSSSLPYSANMNLTAAYRRWSWEKLHNLFGWYLWVIVAVSLNIL